MQCGQSLCRWSLFSSLLVVDFPWLLCAYGLVLRCEESYLLCCGLCLRTMRESGMEDGLSVGLEESAGFIYPSIGWNSVGFFYDNLNVVVNNWFIS